MVDVGQQQLSGPFTVALLQELRATLSVAIVDGCRGDNPLTTITTVAA